MTIEDTPGIESEDLNELELQLDVPPILDKLAVFIQDPENPEQYWYRKIKVSGGSTLEGGSKEAPPYVDVAEYDLGDIEKIPIPKSSLTETRQHMNQEEQLRGLSDDPKLKEMQAVVGVAEYKGNKPFTVDDLVRIVGIKYYPMMLTQLN